MKQFKVVAFLGCVLALGILSACAPSTTQPTAEQQPAEEQKPAETAAMANPFASANVGDWIEYTMTSEAMGQKTESKMTETVTAKDENEITLSQVVEVNGQAMPASEMKISLVTPYDQTMWLQGQNIEKLAETPETITIGETSYDCTMFEYKYTMEHSGTTMESNTKVWIAKNVPLGGMVKMITTGTMNMGGQEVNSVMTMELTGSGSGATM